MPLFQRDQEEVCSFHEEADLIKPVFPDPKRCGVIDLRVWHIAWPVRHPRGQAPFGALSPSGRRRGSNPGGVPQNSSPIFGFFSRSSAPLPSKCLFPWCSYDREATRAWRKQRHFESDLTPHSHSVRPLPPRLTPGLRANPNLQHRQSLGSRARTAYKPRWVTTEPKISGSTNPTHSTSADATP